MIHKLTPQEIRRIIVAPAKEIAKRAEAVAKSLEKRGTDHLEVNATEAMKAFGTLRAKFLKQIENKNELDDLGLLRTGRSKVDKIGNVVDRQDSKPEAGRKKKRKG